MRVFSFRQTALWRAFEIQSRVISALILREIKTRFWRNNLGYLWAFVDPLLHLSVWLFVLLVLRNAGAKPPNHGVGFILFLASGLFPYFLFSKVTKFLSDSIDSNMVLLQYPVVKNVDVIFARFILEGLTELVVGLIVFCLLIWSGIAPPPDNYLGLFAPCAMLLLLGLGLGTVSAVLGSVFPFFNYIMSVTMRIQYFAAGIFFLADSVPADVLNWIVWDPLFHGLELFRSAYFANYKSSVASSSYMLFCGLTLLMFGLALERVLRSKLKET